MARALGSLSWLLVALLLLLGKLASVRAEPPRAGPSSALAARRDRAALLASARAEAAGRPELALRRLQQALGSRPSSAVLLRYAELALPLAGSASARELGERAAHADTLRRALARLERTDSTPEELRRLLLHGALAEALAARYEEALQRVREAGRLQDAATVACLRAIATIAAQRELLALAERALEMARQYMPQELAVMGELGLVQLARGRVREALRVLGERFGIEPQRLAARRDFAYALLSAGRAEEALTLLSALAAECSASLGCALEAARAALAGGRPEVALTFARARLQHGADLDALFVVADAHLHRGELGEARAAYQEVLRLQPASVRAQQALEQLAIDSNQQRSN